MSICLGLDEIIDRHLDITNVGTSPHYRHKKSCIQLSKAPLRTLHIYHLLEEMLECIESNWQRSKPEPKRNPSSQNWRWCKQPDIGSVNQSSEKKLEKAIVHVTGDDWVNQIPTAAGLYDAHHDKHRNVDLAHRINPGEFELIELKVKSNTPLMAAVESLQYAALYLFVRLHYPPNQAACGLLSANIIHCRVLAPACYFCGYNLGWLAQEIGDGLTTFSKARLADLTMDFAFTQFPPSFEWPGEDAGVIPALKAITNVDW